MDEATRCDRVALMQQGRILAVDTPEQITRSFDRALFAVRSDQRYQALLAIRRYPHTHTIYPFGEVLHYTDRRTDLPAGPIREQLTEFLTGQGFAGATAEPIPATIEDSFMAYLGGVEEARPS
jgi:ABC-type multidrug transport system ATPase subunit